MAELDVNGYRAVSGDCRLDEIAVPQIAGLEPRAG
jgi:hypothetical protein